MQATRLLRRNNQKLPTLLSWRFWCWRSFGTSCTVRAPNNQGNDGENSCNSSDNSSEDDSIKVTVVGAAGRVGRTLSLLLKTSPLVDELCMFDIDKSVKGYSVDVSHIDTKCCVSYICGMHNIEQALDDPDVVLIAAGSPTSPQLMGKKLFRKNAPIVAGLSEACARFCPEACIVLLTSPINSLLPVAGEVYELVTGERPSERLFGLTTLDVVRANTFVAEATRRDPSKVIVPVIGGTSEDTIVPVISQMKPSCKIKHEEIVALTECVRQAEGSLTDCQNCGTRGSSSLSTAYAAFRFSSSLLAALKGDKNIIECAYVQSCILPELEYLASPLKLGTCGVEYNYGYPKLSEYEVCLMERAATALQKDIKSGKAYVIEQRGKHYQRRSKSMRETKVCANGNGTADDGSKVKPPHAEDVKGICNEYHGDLSKAPSADRSKITSLKPGQVWDSGKLKIVKKDASTPCRIHRRGTINDIASPDDTVGNEKSTAEPFDGKFPWNLTCTPKPHQTPEELQRIGLLFERTYSSAGIEKHVVEREDRPAKKLPDSITPEKPLVRAKRS